MGDSVLQDLDGLVEVLARELESIGVVVTPLTYGLTSSAWTPQRRKSEAASSSRILPACFVERDLLGLVRLGGGLGDQLVEGRVAVLLVVVAATAREQAIELVVRVRVVGTPAVAGDVVLASGALGEEDAEVAADLLGLETEGCRARPAARNATRGSWPEPELKPNFSGRDVRGAGDSRCSASALSMLALAASRSYGYGS